MKTLDMTLSDFCKVYDMLLNLQKVEMNVPAVWKALKNSLKTMKKSKKLNLNCDEHKKLYDFYCSKL